jgi:TRAP transporter 4TM/12TM fusion protein
VLVIIPPQTYRPTFLLLALIVIFLAFPAGGATASGRRRLVDGLLIALATAALVWPLVSGDGFQHRAATPTGADLAFGVVLVIVLLEAGRRTIGWTLPITGILFLVYAAAGPLLDRIGLSLIAHRGYSIERIIGLLYMTLEGIFGVPLDVAATYIVLFTIFGAVLDLSGAGQFFVDWSLAAFGRSRGGAGPGRTVTVAGYLLGAVSGSGVANTVMLGAVSWPMMRRAGYPPDTAGAILAASGIGAILAPPVMGAAAFLIAQFLNVSYFDVVKMAAIPAFLYYTSIVVTVEAASRRLGLRQDESVRTGLGAVSRAGWFYFLPIAAILALMARGATAFHAVFWATTLAVAVSFLAPAQALWPRRLAAALAEGGRRVVPIVATTAIAGIIVGVVTLTGLGLKAAGLIVMLAGDSLLLTALYAAAAVWLLGLALPVTASYILAAVMVAPALTAAGVSAAAAHMFVFYYAVLSEVSPPTALSPFAAAGVTGGNPFRTTMLSWKYTVPAFLVPFVFTVKPGGAAILLQGSWGDVLAVTATTLGGIALVAIGSGGYVWRRPATAIERGLLIGAGLAILALG